LQRLGIDLANPLLTDWDRLYRRAGGYEGSKLESHFRVVSAMRELNAELTVVHPATVCGHSRSGHILPAQALAGLIANLAGGRLGAIPGSTAHWLPLVTVDFLAELMVAAAFDEQQAGQEILALDACTPNLQGMLQLLAQALGVQAPSRHLPIPVLRTLLKVPGLPRLLHTDAESLDFIQTTRFDTAATKAFAQRQQLAWPDIEQALQATARYLASAPSVA
jgi:dihydroflavonol-4-reductase